MLDVSQEILQILVAQDIRGADTKHLDLVIGQPPVASLVVLELLLVLCVEPSISTASLSVEQ